MKYFALLIFLSAWGNLVAQNLSNKLPFYSEKTTDTDGDTITTECKRKTCNRIRYYRQSHFGSNESLESLTYEDLEAFLFSQDGISADRSSNWEELGPFDMGTITSSYTPGAGRIDAIYVDPNNNQTIYMGSKAGGFWRSGNGGNTWINTTSGQTTCGVNTIAVSPTNPDSVLIGLSYGYSEIAIGILRSVDGGTTWSSTAFNPSNASVPGLSVLHSIRTIKINPENPDEILIGTNVGLFRSDDNLQTITQVFNTGDFFDIEYHPSNPSIVYACNRDNPGYLYKSTDGGQSFPAVNFVTGTSQITVGVHAFNIAVTNDNPSAVFFMGNGLYKSIDEGVTFNQISTISLPFDMGVSDVDEDHILVGAISLGVSTNGGNSWSYPGSVFLDPANLNLTNYLHADIRKILCVNGDFYIGSDGFLCKSSDLGLTWDRLSGGTSIRENYKIGVAQSSGDWFITGAQDNGTSIFQNGNWIEWNGGDGGVGIIHPLNLNYIFGSTQFGERYNTFDGGDSIQTVTPPNHFGASWMADACIDPNAHFSIFSFSSSVHKTEDFGGSWQILGQPNPGSAISNAVVAENNSNIMYVTSENQVFRSDDQGSTFVDITPVNSPSSVLDIAVSHLNDSLITIVYGHFNGATEPLVQMSTDAGASWTDISGNLPNVPLWSCVFDDSDSGYIYVGGEKGVYYKSFSSLIWSPFPSGLPNISIRDLKIQYGTNMLYAASWGRGVWRNKLLNREDYPSISLVQTSKEVTLNQPLETDSMMVTADINYSGQLSQVYLLWSVDSAIFDNSIGMHNTSGNTFLTDQAIPPFIEGTKVFFKVVAIGSIGDTTVTYKFMYETHDDPNLGLGINNTRSFEVFPNPSSGFIEIQLQQNMHNPGMMLLDHSGKVLMEKAIGAGKTLVDITKVAPGLYTLVVFDDQNVYYNRVVKL